jgi:hypothetical protein
MGPLVDDIFRFDAAASAWIAEIATVSFNTTYHLRDEDYRRRGRTVGRDARRRRLSVTDRV